MGEKRSQAEAVVGSGGLGCENLTEARCLWLGLGLDLEHMTGQWYRISGVGHDLVSLRRVHPPDKYF